MNGNGQKVLRKIALAVFSDGKILMSRDRDNDAFYFIGGQLREGESEVECLKRKAVGELGVDVDEKSIRFLNEFEDEAYGRENTRVNIRLYEGKLLGEPRPSGDVEEIKWFDSTMDPKYQTPISRQIFEWLKKHGYIQ